MSAARPPAPHPVTGPAPIVSPAPVKPRRRWGLLGFGLVLVVIGALAAVWLVQAQSTATHVLAVTKLVPRGQQIQADDLAAVPVATGGVLSTVPADQSDKVVGKVATADLLPGTTITSSSYAETLTPAKGRSMVGVTLDQAHRPAAPLRSGDAVRVVQSPPVGGDLDDDAVQIDARVISTQTVDTAVTVNLEVAQDDAAALAQLAASGRATLVVDSSGER